MLLASGETHTSIKMDAQEVEKADGEEKESFLMLENGEEAEKESDQKG